MAGRVPILEAKVDSDDPFIRSPSSSYEVFPGTSSEEYVRSIHPISRNWSQVSEFSSSSKFYDELQEQYQYTIEQCLTQLENINRENESTFIQVKRLIHDKVETMLKNVRQSFEYMHNEGTKSIKQKCEEIGRVLARVEKLLEEENLDFSLAYDREDFISNKTFINNALKEKEKIEDEVEALIQQLNKKRESDEEIYIEFKEEIQQKVQTSVSQIERSLKSNAENRAWAMEEKVRELKRALVNLKYMSKFS